MRFEQLPGFIKRGWPIGLDAQAEWTNGAGDVSAIARRFTSHSCRDRVNLVKISFEPVLLQLVSSGAEGVGLDDIGAGAYVFGVDLADQVGIAEIQLVVAAVDVDALGVEHRSHRAINNEDTVSGEKFSKWLHH